MGGELLSEIVVRAEGNRRRRSRKSRRRRRRRRRETFVLMSGMHKK